MTKLTSKDFYVIGISVVLNAFLLISLALVLKQAWNPAFSARGIDGSLEPLTAAGENQVVTTVAAANEAVVGVVVTKDFGEGREVYNPWQQFGFFSFTPNYPTGEQEVASGSGFFVSDDGLLVTNRHVVDIEGGTFEVVLTDGSRVKASLIATDPILDIALLKAETEEKVPFLEFGDSSQLSLGQTVIAIGNALAEFPNSVSVGVVSGLGRSVTAGNNYGMSEQLDNVIQTDAAINPGNSGGPLLNLQGQVIGVNVAVASGSENIGFALPSVEVAAVVESVKTKGEIERPFLGVRYRLVKAEENEDRFTYGILIGAGSSNQVAVEPGSPADQAGFEAGDIIIAIDGQEVGEKTSLANNIRRKKVGEMMTFRVIRDEKTLNLKAILAKAEE